MLNTVKLIAIILFVFAQPAFAKKEGALSAGMVNPGHEEQPVWFKKSFLNLDEDIVEAKAAGKRLLLFIYQDGCPYCKKLLQDNFGQRDIAEKTKANFDVVSINMWGDREVTFSGVKMTEKKFAEKIKVMYTPTLIFFNEAGKSALRANGYYHPQKFNAALDYVLGGFDKKEKFRAYLARVAPAKTQGKINKEVESVKLPHNFSQLAFKPLLVIFEQKQCANCDELHNDVLKRPQTLALLKKMNVAVLDMWSDEKIVRFDKGPSTMKLWAKALNIQHAPSLVYFNTSGKEVFRSDAYLKSFHIQSGMDYVVSGAYKTQPNFQRYIDARAKRLEAKGEHVDIMK